MHGLSNMRLISTKINRTFLTSIVFFESLREADWVTLDLELNLKIITEFIR